MHDGKVTTPTISTILLVPADGDPHGLLAEGPCGARAPMLCLRPGWETWSRIPVFGSWDATGWRFGLVLAHDGEPVRSGCEVAEWARLEATVAESGGALQPGATPGRHVLTLVAPVLRYKAAEFRVLSRRLAPIGTLIALDPAGRDVTDEVMRG